MAQRLTGKAPRRFEHTSSGNGKRPALIREEEQEEEEGKTQYGSLRMRDKIFAFEMLNGSLLLFQKTISTRTTVRMTH